VGKSPAELPQGQNAGFLLRFLDRKSNRSPTWWGIAGIFFTSSNEIKGLGGGQNCQQKPVP